MGFTGNQTAGASLADGRHSKDVPNWEDKSRDFSNVVQQSVVRLRSSVQQRESKSFPNPDGVGFVMLYGMVELYFVG